MRQVICSARGKLRCGQFRKALEFSTQSKLPFKGRNEFVGFFFDDAEKIDEFLVFVVEHFNRAWWFGKQHPCRARKRFSLAGMRG